MTPRERASRLRDILDRVRAAQVAEALLLQAEATGSENLRRVCHDAILYNLVVVGEAVRTLDPDVLARHPAVPWRDVTGMRNILTHEYFRVSGAIVRAVLDEPLNQLRHACEAELGD